MPSVELHLRYLPKHAKLCQFGVDALNLYFGPHTVEVRVVSCQAQFDLPSQVDLARCDGSQSESQLRVFRSFPRTGARQIVFFVVDRLWSTTDHATLQACSSHPADEPGAILASTARPLSFPHELGHVLGLFHVGDAANLMYRAGTGGFSVATPRLTDDQYDLMKQSPLVCP